MSNNFVLSMVLAFILLEQNSTRGNDKLREPKELLFARPFTELNMLKSSNQKNAKGARSATSAIPPNTMNV